MKYNKPIAILGGMGPEASAYLYTMLIKKAVEDYGVVKNNDFPEIHLQSVPVADFIADEKNKQKALVKLKKRVKIFNKLAISYIAIACNTAHLLLPDLQSVSEIPFVSMINEVGKCIKKDKIKRIGLLGTPMTIKHRLYQDCLEKQHITVMVPTEKQIHKLEKIIRNVIAGKTTRSDKRVLRTIAQSLIKKGAEGIILGCTELPLVFAPTTAFPVYNSVAVLANALLRKYYRKAFKKGGKLYVTKN